MGRVFYSYMFTTLMPQIVESRDKNEAEYQEDTCDAVRVSVLVCVFRPNATLFLYQ